MGMEQVELQYLGSRDPDDAVPSLTRWLFECHAAIATLSEIICPQLRATGWPRFEHHPIVTFTVEWVAEEPDWLDLTLHRVPRASAKVPNFEFRASVPHFVRYSPAAAALDIIAKVMLHLSAREKGLSFSMLGFTSPANGDEFWENE